MHELHLMRAVASGAFIPRFTILLHQMAIKNLQVWHVQACYSLDHAGLGQFLFTHRTPLDKSVSWPGWCVSACTDKESGSRACTDDSRAPQSMESQQGGEPWCVSACTDKESDSRACTDDSRASQSMESHQGGELRASAAPRLSESISSPNRPQKNIIIQKERDSKKHINKRSGI